MSNMFSGNVKKQVPKNLQECYKTDATTTNLWVWCEALEKWGKILFWILIVWGIINAIISSIIVEEVTKGTYYTYTDTETKFYFNILVSELLQTALYAFIEYCAYHVLALLVGSLATIVQHTKISANVALYNTAKDEGYKPKLQPMLTDDDSSQKSVEIKKEIQLKKWLSDGIITEEEYKDMLSKEQ